MEVQDTVLVAAVQQLLTTAVWVVAVVLLLHITRLHMARVAVVAQVHVVRVLADSVRMRLPATVLVVVAKVGQVAHVATMASHIQTVKEMGMAVAAPLAAVAAVAVLPMAVAGVDPEL